MSDLPIGGTTGLDHESTAGIDEAASWLLRQAEAPRPIIPAIRSRFGLTAPDACRAIQEANLRRGRAM